MLAMPFFCFNDNKRDKKDGKPGREYSVLKDDTKREESIDHLLMVMNIRPPEEKRPERKR